MSTLTNFLNLTKFDCGDKQSIRGKILFAEDDNNVNMSSYLSVYTWRRLPDEKR